MIHQFNFRQSIEQRGLCSLGKLFSELLIFNEKIENSIISDLQRKFKTLVDRIKQFYLEPRQRSTQIQSFSIPYILIKKITTFSKLYILKERHTESNLIPITVKESVLCHFCTD